MSNVLLVPTDFSDVCTNAIKLAANAAKHVDYKVYILHIVDKNTKAGLKKEQKGIESIEKKLEENASMIKSEFGIEVKTMAREGSIFSTIGEVAKEVDASLVYMGTHGKTGVQKFIGSYALKVITSSEVPVIVSQKRYFEQPFKEVVLPITSDSGPWEKTKWAAYIAKKFDAKINIFHLDNEAIEDTIVMLTNHFMVNNISYTVKKADSGNFTKQVIEYATSINSELIMIMTNPEKGFSSFLLGSYDEDMIFNSSQIPVMCINPRDFNWKKIVSR